MTRRCIEVPARSQDLPHGYVDQEESLERSGHELVRIRREKAIKTTKHLFAGAMSAIVSR